MESESADSSGFGRVRESAKATSRMLFRASPVIVLLLLWQAIGTLGALPVYVPAPTTIIAYLGVMRTEGILIENSWATLQLVYFGFTGGSALGIIVGVITGRIAIFGKLFDPLVSVTYPIPKIALFPIFVIWFGIGFLSKAVVVFLAAFYPVYIHTFDGVRGVPELHIWSAQNFDASRLQILTEVVIPDSLPQILSGLRVGLALSFIVVFSAELIQSDLGLGQLALQARQFNNYELMFSAISMIALFGVIHDRLLLLTRRRLLYWQGDEH
ncbi:ABC transporter permease [Natronomonas gomsonensis]|jgi:ABC-type nitrate/sulfonate/bicarbonate transport system permease component|uniref:ABC transporter permease n=1 Tax=Natronomonas gomsonensis TaxID=1046043 RepID=UPI0020CA94D2|nr:ABC transporter permease [Natronomonas gomsonensis]MCY4730629.1 ABC transporter permease [Natronomonas gomsonensis]